MKGILAAIMMFTRLPLWKVVQVDKKYYSHILPYWPLTGYITATVTFGVLWGASHILPPLAACILAIVARLLLTGALHEDGLADFFDGFGGGTSKEKILAIMKDSHIGSYGTIGLIVYFLLYASLLYTYTPAHAAGVIFGADICSKLCTAFMINTLPYARTEETSKTGVLYKKTGFATFAVTAVICLIPLWLLDTPLMAILPVIIVVAGLRYYFYKKIGGYTGDCCGASALIAEQVFYTGAAIWYCF